MQTKQAKPDLLKKISTKVGKINMSDTLQEEISKALKSVNGFGSIEIYVQNHSVTQITVRNIKKTKHAIAE